VIRAAAVATLLAVAGAAGGSPPPPVEPPPAAPPRTIAVGPLTAWDLADGSALPPGSEILLPMGIHRPVRLAGLRGSPDAPIRIRSEDPQRLGMVTGGEIGVHLVDCRHVVVETIGVIGPSAAAIRVEGGEGVVLRQLLLARMSRNAPSSGIEAIATTDLLVEGVKIDGWSEAAVDLRAVRGGTLRGLELVAMAGWPNRVGVRVGPACARILVEEVVSAGVPRPVVIDGGAAPPTEVGVRHGLFRGAERAFTLGSGREIVLARNTVVDPQVALAIAAVPAAGDGSPLRSIRIEGNLFFWSPGRLRRFGDLEAGAPAAGVELGENWWGSEELPEAHPLLGPLPVEPTLPQRFGGDPRLDARGVPAAPAAAAFGRPPL